VFGFSLSLPPAIRAWHIGQGHVSCHQQHGDPAQRSRRGQRVGMEGPQFAWQPA